MNAGDTKHLVLASNNAGKLKEFEALFAEQGIRVSPQGALGVTACDEPYHSFIENALHKARHASQQTGLPAVADDSGLVVEALNGLPGVRSARYAALFDQDPSDAANNACLIEQLKSHSNRAAAYIAVLVLVRHVDDPAPLIAQAWWHGEIILTPRGEHGFGYDPHFYLPDLGVTAAELAPERKNQISHRALALRQLLQQIKQR